MPSLTDTKVASPEAKKVKTAGKVSSGASASAKADAGASSNDGKKGGLSSKTNKVSPAVSKKVVTPTPVDDTVYNSVGWSAATFFTNTNPDCLLKTCEVKAKGCKDPYTGKKLKFDASTPEFELKAKNSEPAGWEETVCIICGNEI